jgi:hypothetical protein
MPPGHPANSAAVKRLAIYSERGHSSSCNSPSFLIISPFFLVYTYYHSHSHILVTADVGCRTSAKLPDLL